MAYEPGTTRRLRLGEALYLALFPKGSSALDYAFYRPGQRGAHGSVFNIILRVLLGINRTLNLVLTPLLLIVSFLLVPLSVWPLSVPYWIYRRLFLREDNPTHARWLAVAVFPGQALVWVLTAPVKIVQVITVLITVPLGPRDHPGHYLDHIDYYKQGRGYHDWAHVTDDADYYRHAIQAYNEAIQLHPEFFWAYCSRGDAQYRLGEYAKAIDSFEEAMRLRPDREYSYVARSAAYIKLGAYRCAIRDCDEAIRINAENAGAYRNRGVAYEALGKDREARSDFNKAEELGMK